MTDDHFHLESLEEFREELGNAGFQRVSESKFDRWRGSIHPAIAPLTAATSMDIVITPGWPFQPPAVFVDGLNTNHSTPNGFVCMWREGDFNRQWTTLVGLFTRLEQWCENAVNGWEDDHLDQDALLNFPAKTAIVATFDSVCTWDLQWWLGRVPRYGQGWSPAKGGHLRRAQTPSQSSAWDVVPCRLIECSSASAVLRGLLPSAASATSRAPERPVCSAEARSSRRPAAEWTLSSSAGSVLAGPTSW